MASPKATSRFSRARGLPGRAHATWVASLREVPGRPARILAWAPVTAEEGVDAFCVGSPAVLSVGGEHGWRHVGWHEIEHGGWNGDLHQLSWVQLDGRRGAVQAMEAGRLPELFRERIQATIVVERFVPLLGERGVVVSARRDLGAGGGISWHTRLTRGLGARTEGVPEAVAEALAETRADYGVG